MVRLGTERGVHGDDVAVGQQGGGVDEGDTVLDAARGSTARGRDHGHVEGVRPARDCLADAAVAQDAEGGAGADVESDQHPWPPDPGLPAADQPVALADSPGGVENQREGVVRGGAVEHARSVGDGHSRSFGRGQVDVVESDRHVGDDLQLRPGGGQEIGVDALGQGDDRGTGARDARFEFGTTRWCLRPDPHRGAQRAQVSHRMVGEKP